VVLVIRHNDEGAFGLVINRASPKRFSEVIALSDPTSPSGSELVMGSLKNLDGLPSKNDDAEQTVAAHRDQVYLGGPVPGPMLVLHTLSGIGDPVGRDADSGADNATHGTKTTLHDHPAEPWGTMSIQWADVPAWITADEDHMRLLLRREDADVRYVVHYSGWGPGQLDQEFEAGGWLMTPADRAGIFGDPDTIWESLVKRCGQAIMDDITPNLKRPHGQFDPGLN
ncbi:MAG: YqgE/AlgH family protein, partial [Planctomycetota bacterium]